MKLPLCTSGLALLAAAPAPVASAAAVAPGTGFVAGFAVTGIVVFAGAATVFTAPGAVAMRTVFCHGV